MYFDAHSDIWSDVTDRRLRGETGVFCRRHLEPLRKGGVEGGILVVWFYPPRDGDYAASVRRTLECIRAEAEESQNFRIIRSCDEMRQAEKDGVFYIWVGMEGMAALGMNLDGMDRYYDFGVRHASLTWNEENTLAAGALSGSERGLTDLGKQAVLEIQRRGMLLDVSHLNDAGFRDVARLAERPFVATHSNARALCGTPRNLTDDQLRTIRDVNGVVGLNTYRGFISADPKKQDVWHLAEHAAHMIDVMGIDHVGCGFDFNEYLSNSNGDPLSECTNGIANCTEISNLFRCFEKMGMSHADQIKIARENFQRVLRDVVG
jgi:membrane dipeptidase